MMKCEPKLMKINQPDSRTISVTTEGGIRFFLPYRFSWNGHEREPASVVLETNGAGPRAVADVKAFFLFGMVKDRIASDPAGISITRSWNVMTPGSVRILLDVEFEAPDDVVCLFPGVHVQQGFPAKTVSFLGDRTSYPSALIVRLGDQAAVVFSRSARSGEDLSSIGMSRVENDEGVRRLRVEVRFPGLEEPFSLRGPRPQDRIDPHDTGIECTGTLERRHELFLAFSPRAEILETASAAVLRRLAEPAVKAESAKKIRDRAAPAKAGLAREAERILATHLVEDGGVTGLRDEPGSPWISSVAGLALAVSLRRLFPHDQRLGETALRLADFSLKGQLASGLLYENYHLADREWRGVRGQPARAALSIPQSARIADFLLMLAEDLAGEGLPFEKYFLAGQRFVDLFVDERGKYTLPESLCAPGREIASGNDDFAGWEIFFPLVRVLDRVGRDRYKRALAVIASRFSSASWDIFDPPFSRAKRDPDSAAALLVVRMFLELRSRGFKPAEAPGSTASAKAKSAQSVRLFASLVLPWIRIHGDGPPRLNGALVDSFVRQRLLFAGNETAYLLGGLAQLAGSRELRRLLLDVSRLCLSVSDGLALGTAFFQHTRWDQEGTANGTGRAGPVDSRRLTNEILFGLLATNGPKASPVGQKADRLTKGIRSSRAPRPSGQSARGARYRKPSGKP
jgi:hypothetical protein